LLVIPFFVFSSAFPQQTNSLLQEIMESAQENNLDNEQTEPDIEPLAEELEYLQDNPINLNTAAASDLEKIWFLTDFQVQSLLDYRKSMGHIRSVYELQYVYGYSLQTVEQMKPFIVIAETIKVDSVKTAFRKISNEFLLRAEYKNLTDDSYRGNPIQLFARLKGNDDNKIAYCMLAEKDAGEEFFNGSNSQGFDFYSGFVQLKTKSEVKNIYLGDYRIRAGQGLLLWNGYGATSFSANTSYAKRGQGISGNTSKNEYNFLRGIASELKYKKFGLIVFASEKQIDGNQEYSDDRLGIISINTSGYHRTSTEILRKNNTSEKVFGSTLSYKSEHVLLGFNWVNTNYEYPFLPSENPYQVFNFTGRNNTGLSADYKLLFQKIQFYGEAARSNKSIATVNGINFLMSAKFTGTIFYRNYAPGYFSPYSNSICRNSSSANEQGLFIGFNWRTPWFMTINAYSDVFTFPWLSYYSDKPLNGNENFILLEYSATKDFELEIRYRYNQRDKNQSSENISSVPTRNFVKQNLRLQLRYNANTNLVFTSRVEYCQSGFSGSKINTGYLAFTDFDYRPYKETSLSFRYTFYSIGDYESRIYAYEDDLLYSFAVPSFSGNGQKAYIMLRQKISETFTFWLRYDFTNNFSADSPNRQGIKGQIILKF
jgi:hypothetical protein